MAVVPQRIAERISAGIKRFQPILNAAKSRDVGESDTVTIIVDMLAEVLGYDKYSEITSEHAIRGTFCDLATKIDGVLQMLIEVKAIGIELKDPHVKQAVDYAANQGVDWVILTNGLTWRVYKVTFTKPIDHELVVEFDFAAISHKASKDIETLYLFAKEGWVKSVLGEYHTQKQALSRFFLAAVVLSDSIVDAIRKEVRKVAPDVRIENAEIHSVLTSEVLKREVMEGDKAAEAQKKIASAARKAAKAKEAKKAGQDETSVVEENASDSEPSKEVANP
jgi:hypothetical protein